ncbi:MAG: glycerate kinase [Salinivirgaceae bacterium]|jgi:glycerate kinase|nr:glycerate kinase [Salinivirgaceae bacterium]
MCKLSFLIVPDSFKDCMSASEVGLNIKKGISNVFKNANVEVIPMADGGEGTVESIVSAVGGKIVKLKVQDPIGRETDGFFGLIENGNTAIIEMTAASGIEKLTTEERNPWITSTYGTGQLIKEALNYKCKKLVIGIGGSATNDGGLGMAMALGIKFLDNNGQDIGEGGGSLANLTSIDISTIDSRLKDTKIIAATDVVSPLTGSLGASVIYGPQKGADNQMVQKLDKNLFRLASVIKECMNIDVLQMQGAGAAGGLGAGLHAFLNAEIRSGLDTIVDLIGLLEKIKGCDIIITAEGKVDGQTTSGKTPVGIGRIAQTYAKPVFVFTGHATENTTILYENGISAIVPISRKPETLQNSISKAAIWLQKSAEELCLVLKTGQKLRNL